MLSLTATTKVFLASQPVDMRKGIDGLFGLVRQALGQNPYSGALFVFYGRRRDRLKVLSWDCGGFVLYQKRLERGRFLLPQLQEDAASRQIESCDLALLLAGLQPCERRQKFWQPPAA